MASMLTSVKVKVPKDVEGEGICANNGCRSKVDTSEECTQWRQSWRLEKENIYR